MAKIVNGDNPTDKIKNESDSLDTFEKTESLKGAREKNKAGFVEVTSEEMEDWKKQMKLEGEKRQREEPFENLKSEINQLSENSEFKQFSSSREKDLKDLFRGVSNLRIGDPDIKTSANSMEGQINGIQKIVNEIDSKNNKKTFSTKVKDFLSAAAEVCKDVATGRDSEKSMGKLKESSSLLFRGGSKMQPEVQQKIEDIKSKMEKHSKLLDKKSPTQEKSAAKVEAKSNNQSFSR